MDDELQRRLAANEALFREVNEGIHLLAGSDPSQELAYEYPPGKLIDVAKLERPEMAIAWSIGDTVVESEPMVWPDAVQLYVRPADAAHWSGIFQARLLSPRGASCAVALPDRESIAVLSHGAAYRVWASDPVRWASSTPRSSRMARTALCGNPSNSFETTLKPLRSMVNTCRRPGSTRPETRSSR